ncbi:hypothetical protein D8827_02545 [Streptococcus intermedius]|uniref:DUF1433 domain-containing protein n=1 Tax=Streptococcus intermedius TaxID=1338 RepID=A0AAE8G3N4_STRIT|nr:hypothetical protein [Streptococcus intermedius]RSJ24652.1 hypothetical protein D8827_02545 [Streptococcus intermedius]
MGKKTKLSIVAFVIFVIGGIIMFSLNQKRAQTEAQQIRQELMALYLVNHYEGIHRIEFTSFEQNTLTGTWTSNATVNDKVFVTFSIRKLLAEDEIGFGQHISQSKNNELVEKSNPSDIKEISIIKDLNIIY